jgi:aryl-alcohol dehydrogenase-like predicted oxidoreductase
MLPSRPQQSATPPHVSHPTRILCGQVYAKGQAEEIMGKAFKVTECGCLPAHTRSAHRMQTHQLPHSHAPVCPPRHHSSSQPPSPACAALPPVQELGWKREDIVVSTKVFWGGDGPNDKGLSRKHIIEGTRNCLKRLQLDYV